VNKSHHNLLKTNNPPTFSVIIATFNRAHLLPRSIQSILNQTFSDFELIIVDDGSTDHTGAVIEQIQDTRIRYVYEKNKGRSAARNAGVALAKGQYVTFLDSDDEALPAGLEHFAQVFQTPQTGLVCVGCKIEENGEKRTVLPEDLGNLFDHQTGLFLAGTFALRRELFTAVGGYIEQLSFSENTELALRLIPHCLQSGWQILNVLQPLILYHYVPETFDTERFQTRLDSAAYILEHHQDKLRPFPAEYGLFCGLAGVNAARLNRFREAKHFFAQAIRAEPRNWKHYGRLLMALVPPIARRFWSRQS
jgi:glycosyltransferase involved in cell wall biosynthesis